MDILIKNMEMPKACYETFDERRRHPCPFLFLCRQRATFSEPDHDDIKASDCPLEEVPPHGDLKDIKEIEKHISYTDDFYETPIVDMNDIWESPTIIEAST